MDDQNSSYRHSRRSSFGREIKVLFSAALEIRARLGVNAEANNNKDKERFFIIANQEENPADETDIFMLTIVMRNRRVKIWQRVCEH